jgi:hypothetical protein
MDVSGSFQLAVLVHGVDAEFSIPEEMLGIQSVKDTVTGEDIFQDIKCLMSKYHLTFDKLRGVSTDGAPAMFGSKIGVQK